MKNKSDYRLLAKNLRKTLDIKSISASLVEKIRQDATYKQAKNVMIFYPLEEEVDLRGLISDDKNFYLPKMSGKTLEACPYCDELVCGKYNIMEPCTEPVAPETLDLVVVPALMIDKTGYRLGYGGGFYDRFLPSCKKAVKLVALPKELVIDKLPHDEFDIKIDKIIHT